MNGTFVNGYRLQPNQDVSIGPSTKLVIGPAQFLIQFGPAYEATIGQAPEVPAAASPASLEPGIQASVDSEQPTAPQANPPQVAEPVPGAPATPQPVINLSGSNGNAGTLLDNLISNDAIASDETVDFQKADQHSDLQATRGEEFSGNLAPELPMAIPVEPAAPLQDAPVSPPDSAEDGDDSLNDFLSALE